MATTAKKKKKAVKKFSFAQLQKQIKKDNEKFEKMTPAQKRVAIAEDVLKMLNSKMFIIQQGTYCEVSLKDTSKMKETKDFQEHIISGNVESCKICAMGAVFAAKVRLADGYNLKEDSDLYSPHEGRCNRGNNKKVWQRKN